MEKRFGKKDGIFLGTVALVLLLGCALFWFLGGKKGAVVNITVNGAFYGTYSLDKNQTVEIVIDETVTNVLSIQDGTADMITADCPDLLCVHQKAISREHENIVCLPNRVVVEIVGGEESKLDSIT